MPGMGIYWASNIEEFKIYNERPKDIKIDTIVLHYTVANAFDSYQILTTPHKVSSHYLVWEDGRVDSLVALKDRAWHAGVSSWRGKTGINDNSVGIEIVNTGIIDMDCFELNSNKKTSDCWVADFT